MIKYVGIAFVACVGLAACEPLPETADQKEGRQTKQQTAQISQEVGMPAIRNAFEKKTLRQLYELRDDPNYHTWTYVRDMNGNLHLLCESVGFGIPYSTQFSNPQRIARDGAQVFGTLPQAEPNGLFPPSSAEGTWVMCLDPSDKKVKAVYEENRITSSPFKMN